MTKNGDSAAEVKVVDWEVVHFAQHYMYKDEATGEDKPGVRQVILLYARGEDGVLYEYSGGWVPLPINQANMKKLPQVQPKPAKR